MKKSLEIAQVGNSSTRLKFHIESGNPDYEVILTMRRGIDLVMELIPDSLRVTMNFLLSMKRLHILNGAIVSSLHLHILNGAIVSSLHLHICVVIVGVVSRHHLVLQLLELLLQGDGGGGGVTTGKVRRDNGRWWLVVDASNNVDTLEFTEIFNKRNQDSWLEMITIEAWWKGQMHGKVFIDRGNQPIHEIQLPFDDCAYQYGSGFPLDISVLVAAGFFGYMLALLQRRVGSMISIEMVSRNGDGIRFSCCTVSTNVDLFICGCISPDLGISPLCSVGALLWMELVRLEEACKALRTFKVLEIEKEPVIVDVTCMDNASIKILSVWLDQVMTKLKGHQKRITGLAFSELHGVLVSSGVDALERRAIELDRRADALDLRSNALEQRLDVLGRRVQNHAKYQRLLRKLLRLSGQRLGNKDQSISLRRADVWRDVKPVLLRKFTHKCCKQQHSGSRPKQSTWGMRMHTANRGEISFSQTMLLNFGGASTDETSVAIGTPPRDVIDKVAETIVTAMATYKTETASSTSPHEKTGSAKRSLLSQLSSEAKKKKRYNFNKELCKLLLTSSLKCNLQTDIPGVKPRASLRRAGEKPCCYEK
ncbi:hypothetical protein Tco_0400893 [Tanacetum coccineum]